MHVPLTLLWHLELKGAQAMPMEKYLCSPCSEPQLRLGSGAHCAFWQEKVLPASALVLPQQLPSCLESLAAGSEMAQKAQEVCAR